MTADINWTALWVFVFFFALVTVMGFWASRWKRSATQQAAHLDEWGLGGRSFGTWITWFLVGGDFYTAEQIQPVFGILMAARIRQLYRAMGQPSDFAVVELGGLGSEAGNRDHGAPAAARGFSIGHSLTIVCCWAERGATPRAALDPAGRAASRRYG